jgi:sugar O-acyltransferase (sialic acid O-acetyltransferase NeuD family)
MENNVTLYGASGHGKVIIDVLKSGSDMPLTIIDDNPKSTHILGIPIVRASDVNMETLKNVIISIGNNKVRKKISAVLKTNYVNAIHPSAVISPFSKIGKGTVVMAGAKINPDAAIGGHCIINTGAVIEHDALIGDFVHISPSVSLAGNVTVGEGTHVGIGAVVIQGISIGKWATIGAGTVVIRDVPDYAVVVGNPGKVIKYNPGKE